MDRASELLKICQDIKEASVNHIEQCKKNNDTIKQIYVEVSHRQQMMQKLIKDDIEVLQNEDKLLEEQSKINNELLKRSKQELQELQQKHSAAKHKLLLQSAQHKTQAAEYGNLREEYHRLLEEKNRLQNETAIQLPKKREEVNLYIALSNIHFDFDAAMDEVQGYISNTRDVKTFSFDTTKCSQGFITNSLWDSMKEEN